MKLYVKSSYDFNKIHSFIERALDIKNNQFSNWRSLQDIRDDENIQNLGEVMFGIEYYLSPDYQEATRRIFENLKGQTMLTARDVFQVIFWREIVDVRDKYGQELDGGYGYAQEVFDANPEWLDNEVNFIQAAKTGEILIILV